MFDGDYLVRLLIPSPSLYGRKVERDLSVGEGRQRLEGQARGHLEPQKGQEGSPPRASRRDAGLRHPDSVQRN